MAVTLLNASPATLEDGRYGAIGKNSGTLVLEPLYPRRDEAPILLAQQQSLIGSGADCPIRLSENGIQPRHALLRCDGPHIVIKALDRRTWLNGCPVTESRMRDGDLLAIGPVEFRVRRAHAAELVSMVPADRTAFDAGRSHFEAQRPEIDPASSQLERERLQMAANQTESQAEAVRAELEMARSQLQAERLQFEADRLRFEEERAKFEAGRVESVLERVELDPEHAATQPVLAAGDWNDDVRFSRFFQKAPRPTTVLDVDAATSTPVLESCPEQCLANEPADVADSVAEYMERLLQRSRSGRTARGIVDEPSHEQANPFELDLQVAGEPVPASVSVPAPQVNEPQPSQTPSDRTPRRRQAVDQIRAGVGSFREIANLSARAAVANHSTRKLRRSLAVTLALTILALLLARGIDFLGGGDRRFDSLAFGMQMLGAISLIAFAQFWLQIKRAENNVSSSTFRSQQDAIGKQS
jgi:pSer/pThr/pTyr-binding forkhead associated (FHA) protein